MARRRRLMMAVVSSRMPTAPARAWASIGEETVKTHVSNILSKLHLADRTQAAIYGLQQRLVPLDDALE
jgi:two-component system, NarL family, response regulator LiaR